jgi:dihydroorotase-like cyclic amidohydrolase
MLLDLIIRGGTIETAADAFRADIGVARGRIVALGEDLAPAGRVIDASGKPVLPGGIDSHVHIVQAQGFIPGEPDPIVMADDLESGTQSPVFGGNTTVMPFCLQQKGQSWREASRACHALADGKLTPKGRSSFHWVPNGIPGIETRRPVLFSEGVNKGRLTLNPFVALTSTNHAKVYGLHPRNGTAAVGSHADIAIWDPQPTVTIRHDLLHDGCDDTPHEGVEVTGWPVTTRVRGPVIVDDGQLIDDKAHGTFRARERPALARTRGVSPMEFRSGGLVS